MEASAYIKYLRISPKKIRELTKLTVGLTPQEACERLNFSSNKASRLLSAVINSARANAVNNLKMNEDNLVIKSVRTEKGPFFKRWRAVSRGMAHQIKKRTSHLKVTVIEKKKPINIKQRKLEIKNIAKKADIKTKQKSKKE